MLYVGDDWAEDHHDIAVCDEQGMVLRQARIPDGSIGISAFGEVVGQCLPPNEDPAAESDEPVAVVCIEVDHGPWVQALVAAGYRVYGVDPKQAARHREILSNSGAKSDKGDAVALADMVRFRRHQLRQVGTDSDLAEAIGIAARAHQRAIWETTRHTNRLRAALRQYFPAILIICAEVGLELKSAAILGLLEKAPTPEKAAKLSVAQILPFLKRRQDKQAKAERIQQILRAEHLGESAVITAGYVASAKAEVAFIRVAVEQTVALQEVVADHFSRHPDAEIYLSQPGVGLTIGPRLLGEFGDDPSRYRSAKARKNAAQTSPITRQSGKSWVVSARWVGNDRLLDAALAQAQDAILHDEHARAYYRKQRDRGVEHNAALRQLANKLVGVLHGCLAGGSRYDPAIAWHITEQTTAA